MPIPFLNFQHLYYFWMAAREGGISHAGEVLDLSPSTISAQINQLEAFLRVRLFRKVGRNIRLTDVGQIAFSYADQIFGLGRELTQAVESGDSRGRLRLQVGIADAGPKLVAHEASGARVRCFSGDPPDLPRGSPRAAPRGTGTASFRSDYSRRSRRLKGQYPSL